MLLDTLPRGLQPLVSHLLGAFFKGPATEGLCPTSLLAVFGRKDEGFPAQRVPKKVRKVALVMGLERREGCSPQR